jgi:hypothetical protein
MILEGLLTTCDADGELRVAPMGPSVDERISRLVLRPFPTSTSYQNLRRHPEGVFHVTDDALLLARAAIGRITEHPPTMRACSVRGFVLTGACRAYEFRVVAVDESEPRHRLECEVVHCHDLRHFFGFNRAKHAVVEAAIWATRVHLFPRPEILREFDKWDEIVRKTGGAAELKAMQELRQFVLEEPT